MANVNRRWRGAVQPAGDPLVATGNENKLWRGAVEPAYVPPAPGVSDGKKTGPSLSFGSMGKMGAS